MSEPKWKNKFLAALPILFALIFWQLYVQLTHNELLPAPLAVLKAIYDLAVSHILFEDCSASLKRVFIGFCFAALFGIIGGLALGVFARLRAGLLPIIELLRPIPPIAWIPIAITFFGIGDASSCFVIFIGAFYPIFTNTLLGVKEIPQIYIDAAKMLGATKSRIYKEVILPCALPNIFAGLSIGLGFAWACVVAAEMIAARSGLGYEIQLNRQLLQLDRVIAGMAVIGLIGVLMSFAMRRLEEKMLPWRNVETKRLSAEEGGSNQREKNNSSLDLIHENIRLIGASLALNNVNFSFKNSNTIIENISLTLKPGEFLCILGPSGCGKTSLLKLIAGLNNPNSGIITLDNGNISNHKSEVTMVFQNGALFPWLTALDNVMFALQSKGLSRDQAINQAKGILLLVGLENRRFNYPAQLSGGQQQRVALARALAYHPRLILMDEPFSALDSQTRELLQQDVGSLLSQMGVSVIMVTHDVREAVFMSDRVMVLSKQGGQILKELTIETPRHARDEDFRHVPEFGRSRKELWDALNDKTGVGEIVSLDYC